MVHTRKGLAFAALAVLGALAACSGDIDQRVGGTSTGGIGGASTSSHGEATATSTSAGGAACSGCASDTDCPPPEACATYACNGNGCCSIEVLPAGAKANDLAQTDGDCQVVECDGTRNGAHSVNDSSDPPSPLGPCYTASCFDSNPVKPVQLPIGGPCNVDGGKVCGNASNPAIAGTCVGCNVDGDCTDPKLPKCGAGNVCGASG